MEKEFVTYNQALALKGLGFDEPCLAFWDGKNTDAFYFNNIRDTSGDYTPFQKHDRLKWFGAPLYQQAFRWFREKYNWTIKVNQVTKNNWSYTLDNFPKDRTYYGEVYKTYEEAESGCIDKLIEIVKQGK